MYTLSELQPKIIEWAKEKDLIKFENAFKQRLKLIEECGELASAILKNNIELQKDAVGDIYVVITILAKQVDDDFDISYISNNADDIQISDLINSIIYFEHNRAFEFLIEICKRLNLNLDECVNLSWNEIKNRKGVTLNGTFIKN